MTARFESAAAELRQQELARLANFVPPTPATCGPPSPSCWNGTANDLTVTKDGRKYLIACAPPADTAPTRTAALVRLHNALIAASAEAGFYVTTRGFTPAATDYCDVNLRLTSVVVYCFLNTILTCVLQEQESYDGKVPRYADYRRTGWIRTSRFNRQSGRSQALPRAHSPNWPMRR